VLLPPAPGYVVGRALARGMAWGAGFAIGHAIWDNFDYEGKQVIVAYKVPSQFRFIREFPATLDVTRFTQIT
jgi:hypothetical protein